jgi:hypothetical protein
MLERTLYMVCVGLFALSCGYFGIELREWMRERRRHQEWLAALHRASAIARARRQSIYPIPDRKGVR